MAKYKKKPIIIEAIKYNSKKAFPLREHPQWIHTAFSQRMFHFGENRELLLLTLEGNMKVSDGDYIIKGVQGELYPCKPDIFEATYEKVE